MRARPKHKKFFVTQLTILIALTVSLATGQTQLAYVTNHLSNSVSAIDLSTNTVTANLGVQGLPWGVALTTNGSRAYVANQNSLSVSVIDTATNTVIATVGVEQGPSGVAITPDGTRVYVTNSGSSSVSVLSTSTNTVVATVGVGSGPVGVAIAPDGSHAYVTNIFDDSVSVIDTTTNAVITTVAVGHEPNGVAVTPDGSRAYVANNVGGSISVIETSTNIVATTIPIAQPVSVAISPDGSRAYVSTNLTGAVSVIDTTTNTVIDTIAIGANAQGLAITPDGTRIYVASYLSNSVYVIDSSSNIVTATVAVGLAPLGIAIPPGPTNLISSLNPSIYGHKITLAARVKPFGQFTPTGKVVFTRKYFTETFPIGSATLNASGVATVTRSNLNAGFYPITATYSGDANNPRSTSEVLNQVVVATTSAATLTSSPNPSMQGQAVTFTAKITSPTVKPTGPVTFTEGKLVLGTVQLSGGKATLTMSSLPVGSTKVTATYYGNSNIAKSSASVTQTVR